MHGVAKKIELRGIALTFLFMLSTKLSAEYMLDVGELSCGFR